MLLLCALVVATSVLAAQAASAVAIPVKVGAAATKLHLTHRRVSPAKRGAFT